MIATIEPLFELTKYYSFVVVHFLVANTFDPDLYLDFKTKQCILV